VEDELVAKSFYVAHSRIDVVDFRRYLNAARYEQFDYFDQGKAQYFIEKTLEHYVAAKFLNLSECDIFIDIASSGSPASEIYRSLFGCKTHRQDVAFPVGVQGNTIGGDAGSMPMQSDFATAIALHCSFEHFEGDSDIRFIREAGRILRRGGSLCILPLYLLDQYAIRTDPCMLSDNATSFDHDAVLFCVRGRRIRHERFYDIRHFVERVRNNLGPLELSIHVVDNEKEVHESCYLKFVAVFRKGQ
jgi:SAM-dependent methyltransferase